MDDVATVVLAWLSYIFIEFIGCTLARALLPVLSLGWIHVAPLTSSSKRYNRLGYRGDERDRIEVEGTAAGLLGLVIITIVVVSAGWFVTFR